MHVVETTMMLHPVLVVQSVDLDESMGEKGLLERALKSWPEGKSIVRGFGVLSIVDLVG